MRFAPRADAAAAGHRPEDRRAAGGAGVHDRRAAAGGRRGAAGGALRRPHGALPEGARGVPRRLAGGDRARRRQVGLDRATFDKDIADLAELEQVLRGCRAELCEGLRGQGPARAHDRDQGPPGRLDDGHARAHAGRRRRTTPSVVTETALELLRVYGPPQPVRLLGVRLAGFDDVEPDRPPPPAPPVGPARAASSSTGLRPAAGATRAPAGDRRRARRARRRPPGAGPRASSSSEAAIASISGSSARSRVARVERRERLGQRRVLLQPQPRGEAVGGERAGDVAQQPPARPRARRGRPACAPGPARRRRGRARAPARGAGRSSPPCATSASASDGTRPSRKRVDLGRRLARR